MPNTLVHLGTQGPASRTLFRDVDPRWIYAGLLIPDLPWIVRRGVLMLPFPVDPSLLWLYAHAQASLAAGLLLAAAVGFLARRGGEVFGVLSLNILLHLLLDATQRKWGNGVHLIAPFDWELWSLDLYWPDHPLIYGLSFLGFAFVLVEWLRGRGRSGSVVPAPGLEASGGAGGEGEGLWQRWGLSGLCLAGYVLLPFLAIGPLWERDLRSLRTLADREDRVGHYVEFDRNRFRPSRENGYLSMIGGEEVVLRGEVPDEPTVVSVRGRFATPDTVDVIELYEHQGSLRDHLSYLGLVLIISVWAAGPLLRFAEQGASPETGPGR